MDFVLYVVDDEEQVRVSLSYSVDQHYWFLQGRRTYQQATTRSMGRAMQQAVGDIPLTPASACSLFSSDFSPNVVWWEQLKEQAQMALLHLEGRALLWPEVERLMEKQEWEGDLPAVVQWLFLQGKVEWLPAVDISGAAWHWKCHRCLSDASVIREIQCFRCEEKCAMCEQCLLLGKASACELFLLFSGKHREMQDGGNGKEKEKGKGKGLESNLTLTRAQQVISDQLQAFLDSDKAKCLVWAVTGAGKTEMLVPLISRVLSQGGRVLWVTPRKDVVLEIAPRLKAFFQQANVVTLYGGSSDAWQKGNLFVTTAHQAWRFYDCFDLAIVDEVDAFPLYGNQGLENGILRACVKGRKQILLTATPPRAWQHKRTDMTTCVLPVRYHGLPLPVPRIVREWFLEWKRKTGRAIPAVSSFLQCMREKEGQALIFVPRVQDAKGVLEWILQQEDLGESVAAVYSQDPERKKKVELFREGKLRVLITTTILERGVTVPKCFVLVWGADHPIFDRASLVQIAGRVGRSDNYQQGEVWFLAGEKTASQQDAKKEIKRLNQMAKKEGFLKEGAY